MGEQNFRRKICKCFFVSEKTRIFALAKRKVAQLVAHYVRDVGVGRSSRLFPTCRLDSFSGSSFFVSSLNICGAVEIQDWWNELSRLAGGRALKGGGGLTSTGTTPDASPDNMNGS